MVDIAGIIREVFGISRGRYRLNMPILVRRTRDDLGEAYRRAGFTTGAEIGVRRGEYSIEILKRHPGMHLYCVDMWGLEKDKYQVRRERYLKQARQTLAGHQVTFIQERSLDAVCAFQDESLDCVYIDAAHDFDNAVQDIIQWSAKVKRGGIVALHDYYQHRYGGVVPAVDSYVRCHNIRPWYVTYEVMPTVFWVKP